MIEPGAVTTDMLGRVAGAGGRVIGEMNTEQRGRYPALMRAVIAQAQAAIPKGVPANEAARVIADAISSKRPRRGADAAQPFSTAPTVL